MFPGRSLEVPGDRHPREMIMAPWRDTEFGLQPTPFFIILDSVSWG